MQTKDSTSPYELTAITQLEQNGIRTLLELERWLLQQRRRQLVAMKY
jgi:hypothetical protein